MGSFEVSLLRSKGLAGTGVSAVTNPQKGVFCIKPAAHTNIVPSRVVPTVVTDRQSAPGVVAMWAAKRYFCVRGRIEVHGQNLETGELNNAVSFGVVVN